MVKTAWGVAVVMSLLVATSIWTMSGYGGVYQQNPASGLSDEADQLQRRANDSVVGNTTAGSGKLRGSIGSQDPSIVSFAINGATRVLKVATLVVLLPIGLMELGFPIWFAIPVGTPVSIMTSIGIIQFVAGRLWR